MDLVAPNPTFGGLCPFRPQANAIPQDALANALHASRPDCRARPSKKASRPARKAKTPAA